MNILLLGFLPSQLLFGPRSARAEVPSQPQPVPREVPGAGAAPGALPAALLLDGVLGQPCLARPCSTTHPAWGTTSTSINPAPGSSQSSPSGEGHYLSVVDAENTPWLSSKGAHGNKTNFICATCRGFPSTYSFPQSYCMLYAVTSYHRSPAGRNDANQYRSTTYTEN